ncbi:MAG: hypothetical protein IJY06_03365 [Oscillospiraceae bacterium]|jgi:hypothetical protein|nr:hypothetical protein [Oscillospiraceae bacterium]
MTDKELRRLKRTELLEIVFYLQKELEDLRRENESLRQGAGGITEDALAKITAAVKEAVLEASKKEAEVQQ